MKISFDECFQVFPPLNPPQELHNFWKNALDELKKIPVEPQTRMVLKRSLGRESQYEASFNSIGGQRLQALFSVPRKRGRVPCIITFHDYGDTQQAERDLSHQGCAHLAVQLRGHVEQTPSTQQNNAQDPAPAIVSPLTLQGLGDPDRAYPTLAFLDAMRCLDFLRLQKSVDTSRIGLLGHGFGAAMAIFLAMHAPESVQTMALERPGFVWLDCWMDDAQSQLARETKQIVKPDGRVRPKIKKTLQLFDPLHWSENIKVPVFMQIGLADTINPPRPAFGFFNHLRTEKDMGIFPNDVEDPAMHQQREQSFAFLKEQLLGPE